MAGAGKRNCVSDVRDRCKSTESRSSRECLDFWGLISLTSAKKLAIRQRTARTNFASLMRLLLEGEVAVEFFFVLENGDSWEGLDDFKHLLDLRLQMDE